MVAELSGIDEWTVGSGSPAVTGANFMVRGVFTEPYEEVAGQEE